MALGTNCLWVLKMLWRSRSIQRVAGQTGGVLDVRNYSKCAALRGDRSWQWEGKQQSMVFCAVLMTHWRALWSVTQRYDMPLRSKLKRQGLQLVGSSSCSRRCTFLITHMVLAGKVFRGFLGVTHFNTVPLDVQRAVNLFTYLNPVPE